MLMLAMLGSLVLAAALPSAFHGHGLLVAITYAAIQVGRALFLIWGLRGNRLQLVFVRVLPWSFTSGVIVIIGGLEGNHVRELLWALSVALDLVGAAFGFFVPGVGRSDTTDWTISGSHFAERCQAFVLIALGESIVVIGSQLRIDHPSGHDIGAFAVAFAGAVGLWWVYFDRVADDSARRIAGSHDPGRLARNAFHWVHPLIVGGIIVVAAGQERVLDEPAARAGANTGWLVLGGTALFLAGHAIFKAVMWRVVSWPRVVAVAALAALSSLVPHVSALTIAACALTVIVCVAIADRVMHLADHADTTVRNAERSAHRTSSDEGGPSVAAT
jgi:low temperature requirement protein LtrA